MDKDKVFVNGDLFRPTSLDEFIGFPDVISNLRVFIKSAIKRKSPLDHVLLVGPPGTGKTSLARLIAKELGTNFVAINAPAISKPADLLSTLTNLKSGDVLFIDEFHRLPKSVEEVLMVAMEDFVVDYVVESGPYGQNIRISLMPFTVVAATTRPALISSPLRSRFGITFSLSLYDDETLKQIVQQAADKLNVFITEESAGLIATCSRGTPRIALNLLKRMIDFATVSNRKIIDAEIVGESLKKLGIHKSGLHKADIKFLRVLMEHFDGGPAGINAIASLTGDEPATLEEVIEPFLLQKGLVVRTPRGRILTDEGKRLLQEVQKGM
ncbi:MAG: Holliday junction branch migration DNA helicase RuvB [Chlorobi bacterium]|nr:Holliday junction branch migration DNA helicase RuvB [Chlorobiota bacterium]